ncbi:MAG: hypothetical protein Q9224_006022 [Gallowayella concinna]
MTLLLPFRTPRKFTFLVQAVLVFFLAGSLLFAFANLLPPEKRLSYSVSGHLYPGGNSESHLAILATLADIAPSETVKATSVNPGTTSVLKDGNATLLQMAPKFVHAIMTPEDASFDRLSCPTPNGTRYQYLQSTSVGRHGYFFMGSKELKYFFALDLTQCIHVLPRLIGSIVEAIYFLGPQNCALSIIEGLSKDGTYEVLLALREELERLGTTYYLTTSDVNSRSSKEGRIEALATLRNLALEPLLDRRNKRASSSTTILFLNDVSLCLEDILELIHQRKKQNADMVCAMDWSYWGPSATFYDVWIARDMHGQTFFEIPPSGSWDRAWNIFWKNDFARASLGTGQPFQVYSCWNGATAFTAAPFLDKKSKVRFRAGHEGECPQGEPTLMCKDFWLAGYRKIAVVPSVNVEYSDAKSKRIKELKGYTSRWVESHADTVIEWRKEPPEKVRCLPIWAERTGMNQTWEDWDAPRKRKVG